MNYTLRSGITGSARIGTQADIADVMQEWFENGACDGFNVTPTHLPGGCDDFVELVVPELQRRGLFRTDYEGKTLRENLGLKRPASRYAAAGSGRKLGAAQSMQVDKATFGEARITSVEHRLPLFYERPCRFLEILAVLRLPLHRVHPRFVTLGALQAQLVDEELRRADRQRRVRRQCLRVVDSYHFPAPPRRPRD